MKNKKNGAQRIIIIKKSFVCMKERKGKKNKGQSRCIERIYPIKQQKQNKLEKKACFFNQMKNEEEEVSYDFQFLFIGIFQNHHRPFTVRGVGRMTKIHSFIRIVRMIMVAMIIIARMNLID